MLTIACCFTSRVTVTAMIRCSVQFDSGNAHVIILLSVFIVLYPTAICSIGVMTSADRQQPRQCVDVVDSCHVWSGGRRRHCMTQAGKVKQWLRNFGLAIS